MIKNYFKIAIRQLLKSKLFSALNIFGLATSLAVCMLLIMILADQYGYDEFHENKDRIFRIITAKKEKQVPMVGPGYATTSLELAEELKGNYSFIENTVRMASMEGEFRKDGKVFYSDHEGYVVDASFLDIFSFGWSEGDKANALKEPRSLILSEVFF